MSTTSGREGVTAVRRTRPRDRRALTIDAATDLFCRDGYPAVSMGDIAAAVGVRPSALYRHFDGKQDLLLAAVQASFEPGAGILDRGLNDLDAVLRALAIGALDQRHLGVLWQRESRHLSPAQRSELRQRVQEASRSLRETITADRPGLDDQQATFLAACVFGVLISVSYQRAEMPRSAYVSLLHELAVAVARNEVPDLGGDPVVKTVGFALSSRRERLLAAAVKLFAGQGFSEVGVGDIAQAAGIAQPSFYHHFRGKADVLWAILERGDQAIRTDLARALSRAEDPADALRRAMRSYIALALDSPELIEAMVWQVSHLAADRRAKVIEIQHDLVGEWLALIAGASPDLGRARGRIRVQAALTLVNNIAMTPQLRAVPGVAEAMGAVVDRILGLPVPANNA